MFGIGTGEILLLLVIALLVLGPERLPHVARDLGRIVGELRRTSDELRDELLNADRYVAPSTPTPALTAPGATAATESAPAGPSDEHPFDREMREARERLRGM